VEYTYYVPAGTQTLSAAAISAFGTSVMKLTRCRPGFFFGMLKHRVVLIVKVPLQTVQIRLETDQI